MLNTHDVAPTSNRYAPAAYVGDDETPNMKDRPEDWLKTKSDCGHNWVLETYEEGRAAWVVAVGGSCQFTVNQSYPDITVKVTSAEEFEILSGQVPAKANQFYVDDWESAMVSLPEFIREAFDGGEIEAGDEVRVTVRRWDEETFVLGADDKFRAAGALPQGTVAGRGEVIVGAFELSTVLTTMRGVVERRNTIPILGHVLVRAVDGLLEITTTDLDQRLTWVVPAVTPDAGGFDVTIPFRQLEQFARLADGYLMLELAEGKTRIGNERRHIELHRLAPDDFPTGPKHKAVRSGTIFTSQFHERLERVRHAISREETRYHLNGVCFHSEGEDGDLAIVSTDGHRLAKETLSWSPGKGDPLKNSILPRRTISTISGCINDATGIATLEFGEMSCRLTWSNGWASAILVSKLIDGTYPPYERVVPKEFGKSCVICANALAEAAVHAACINADKMLVLSLEFDGKKVLVEAKAFDADFFAESLDAPFTGLAEGEKFKIGFNGGYLQDIAQLYLGQDLLIEFADPASPVRITAPAMISRGFHIQMPMRV